MPDSSARLTYEALQPHHAELMFDHLQREEIYAYLDDTAPTSRVALRARYATLSAGAPLRSRQRWLNWVVRLQGRDEVTGGELTGDRVIGTIQATVHLDAASADIAYVFFPSFWGRGYAGEATAWMIEQLRDVEQVEHLRASIDPGNARSIALVERLGFTRCDDQRGPDDDLGYRRHLRDPGQAVGRRS